MVRENKKKYVAKVSGCTPRYYLDYAWVSFTYRVYKNSCYQTDTFLFLPQNIYKAFPYKNRRSDNEHFNNTQMESDPELN